MVSSLSNSIENEQNTNVQFNCNCFGWISTHVSIKISVDWAQIVISESSGGYNRSGQVIVNPGSFKSIFMLIYGWTFV